MIYRVKPTKTSPLVVIDTSGKLTASVLKQYAQGIFITDTGVTVKNATKIQHSDFSDLPRYRITKQTLTEGISRMKYYAILSVPFYDAYYYIGKLITALLLALLGLVAGAVLGTDITFSNAFKIGIYSLTLPMILDTLHVLIGESIPHFSLLYYVLAIVYVILALSSMRTQKLQDSLSPFSV